MTDLRRRLTQRLRLVNRDFDERLRSASRFAATLLPLLQRGDSYAEQFRELRLRKLHGNARLGDDGFMHRALAIVHPDAPDFATLHLRERLAQFRCKVAFGVAFEDCGFSQFRHGRPPF